MDYTYRLDDEMNREFSNEPADVFDSAKVYFVTAEISGVEGICKMTGNALNELDAESNFSSTLDNINDTWHLNGVPVIWS